MAEVRAPHDNARSGEIFDSVQIGTTKLKPGNYRVEWQGSGPAVEVSFRQNGKSVVTAPGTLKTNDDHGTPDAIVTEATGRGYVNAERDRFRSPKKDASC